MPLLLQNHPSRLQFLPLLQSRDQRLLQNLPQKNRTGLEILRFLQHGNRLALSGRRRTFIFGDLFKKKILIIDDEEQNSLVLSEFLKMQGFTTQVAKNGMVGLEAIEKFSPDLVFLDIRMPGLSGVDTLKMIKSDPKMKKIPVLMCTAMNTLNEVEECYKFGASGYITKPYDLDKILERARATLEKGS